MGYFLTQWAVLLVGAAAHIALDRHPDRRTLLTDFLQPLVALVFLVLFRRTSRAATGRRLAPAWD